MSEDNEDYIAKYMELSWHPFYISYFQELASQLLAKKWERIEIGISMIVAITASGSAISGLALWNKPGFKAIWSVFAIASMVASIVYKAFKIPGRIKDQVEINKEFLKIRIEFDVYRQQLKAANTRKPKAEKEFNRIMEAYKKTMISKNTDIAFTSKFNDKVQRDLDKLLAIEGYIS